MSAPLRFPLLGEPIAIDLVNTRVRQRGAVADLLDTTAALTAWLRAERPRVNWRGPIHAADLTAARALRDAIGRLFQAHREHTRPSARALQTVNRALSRPAPHQHLGWDAHGARWAPREGRRQHNALHALALDAAQILTGPDGARLRQCAHPDCVLLFIARNPRRRWCISDVCGNRARVARHYVRHHETS